MIFQPKELCAPLFCKELTEEGGACTLMSAPFVAVLVSRGHAALSADSAAQLLGAGALFLARGVVEVTPATECHLLAVGLGGFAAQQAGAALEEPAVSDGAVCPMAGQAMAELRDSLAHGAPDALLSEQSYRVLCTLAGADAGAAALPPLVADAVLAIRQNYAGLYGVEELSAQLGVSKSHLVRAFSAAMGEPPGQYLTRVRLEAAKQLLLRREYSLEIVASLCGFSGANYFCKVFKKSTGTTPAVYRAQHTGTVGRSGALNALEKALYI